MKKCSAPEIDWEIPGFLSRGLTVLAGKPKSGKSWLGLGLALAMATNGKIFGKTPAGKGEVLFLGLDDNPRRLKNRLLKLQNQNSALPENLFLAFDCPPLSRNGRKTLSDWLDHHPQARLIVIDPLLKIAPLADPRSLKTLQKLAVDYQISILAVVPVEINKGMPMFNGAILPFEISASIWYLKPKTVVSQATLQMSVPSKTFALSFTDGVWRRIPLFKDPIVAEVRKAREAYAKKFNYDMEAICEDLRNREQPSDHKDDLSSKRKKLPKKPSTT